MPMLKRPDAEIYYEVHGAGFPILLYAPGGLGSRVEMWGGVSPNYPNGFPWMDPRTALADKYTVIAMDQRNAGKSVADVKPDHGWHTFAADHLALMDHLGFKKFHVLGGCIGGSYCFEAIEQAPDRVASAVLQNPIGLWENRDSWDAAIKGYGETVRAPRSIDPAIGHRLLRQEHVRPRFRVLRHPRLREGLPYAALPAARHGQAASGPHQRGDRGTGAQHRGPEGLEGADIPAGVDQARARLPRQAYAQVTMRHLALAAILAITLAPAARAQQTWVAVATDGRRNFGYAVGMATREAAEQTSLGECVGDCAIRLAAPARCVAYARSDPGNASGYAAGATLEAVRQAAWDDCNRRVPSNSCVILASRCFE